LDRLTVTSTEFGSIRYSYDRIGRRTSMTASGQAAITYVYDANSRLRQVVRGSQIIGLDYDALDRRSHLTLPNGVTTQYLYDKASRLTELVYKNNAGTIGNLTYQYDGAGNRRGTGGTLAQTTLPDAVASANYDAANRQLQFGQHSMTYDPAGNMISMTTPAGITNLLWDARHRLTRMTGPAVAADFSYDALGRRRTKQTSNQLSQFLYDGLNVLSENAGATRNNYLGSLGIDEPWAKNDSEFYVTDALGSVIALTSASGALTSRYIYDPFGNVAQGSSANPFQFTARENDGTGLLYYRSRYYSPILHRFISEDPIRFWSRDTNFYAYVSNRPLNAVDPLGLDAKSGNGAPNPPGGGFPTPDLAAIAALEEAWKKSGDGNEYAGLIYGSKESGFKFSLSSCTGSHHQSNAFCGQPPDLVREIQGQTQISNLVVGTYHTHPPDHFDLIPGFSTEKFSIPDIATAISNGLLSYERSTAGVFKFNPQGQSLTTWESMALWITNKSGVVYESSRGELIK